MQLIQPVNGTLSDPYGYRNAIPGAPGSGGLHTGQDFAAQAGEPIYAAAAGTVVAAWWDAVDGVGMGGNMVAIDHGNGWETRYAHMLNPSVLRPGASVRAGDHVGFVGATGSATGPHLHFELLRYGGFVDPMPYIGTSKEDDEMIVTIQGEAGKRPGGAWLLAGGMATFLGDGVSGNFPHFASGSEALRKLAGKYSGITF